MAIVKRYISYSIPESADYNQIQLMEASTETGTYTLKDTLNYTYPTRATEYNSIDTTKWYKIIFYDSANGLSGPTSDAFYGGHYDEQAGFAVISSTFDGAGYATTSNFYAITNLDSTKVSTSDVAKSLKIARAYIDLITDDQSPYRYSRDFTFAQTRRKYNAQLELIKSAEVYFAAALIYQDKADDSMANGISGCISDVTLPADLNIGDISPSGALIASGITNISIGQTSISDSDTNRIAIAEFNLKKEIEIARYNLEKNLTYAKFLDERQMGRFAKEIDLFRAVAAQYAARAGSLINMLKPPTVPVRYGLSLNKHKFLDPGDIFSFGYNNSKLESQFVGNVAELSGITPNASGYLLDSVTVNGVAATAVYPAEIDSLVLTSYMTVNGVTYWLDDWTDHNGVVQPGKDGATGGAVGFSIDFNTGVDAISLTWNYITASGGADLTVSDEITYYYTTIN